MYICKYVYMYICIYVYTHAKHIYVCIYIFMFRYICIPPAFIHTYMHTYIHTCIHTCMHAYIHTYRQTDRQTYIQTDIHTYILHPTHPTGGGGEAEVPCMIVGFQGGSTPNPRNHPHRGGGGGGLQACTIYIILYTRTSPRGNLPQNL